jgi:hypothetical protein
MSLSPQLMLASATLRCTCNCQIGIVTATASEYKAQLEAKYLHIEAVMHAEMWLAAHHLSTSKSVFQSITLHEHSQ